jgi:putrescine---pyruvate transaminase
VNAPATTAFWHPFANMAEVEGHEVVLTAADGAEVVDAAGRRYLDATAGLWFCAAGWGRREIAEAAARQMALLPAYSTFGPYANRPALELAERLSALAPMPEAKVFFGSGGSDGVDTAAKLARRYWAAMGEPTRRVVISRQLGYHGMHAFGTSLGGIEANAEGLGVLVGDTHHVPWDSAAALDLAIERFGRDHVAAFIGEPVIGAGGVIAPEPGYWEAVQDVCRRHDVLLIADEVICGFGRLGRWFGCERFGIEPDLVVFAKGVTSGYLPLGGVLVGERVQEPFWTGAGTWLRHGYTYSGHAAACAAGLANLAILEREQLIERAAGLERPLADALSQLADHPLVGEVRAIGLAGAVELAAGAMAEDPGLVERIIGLAREEGVLTRALRGSALHVSPPLVVTEEQLTAIARGTSAGARARGATSPRQRVGCAASASGRSQSGNVRPRSAARARCAISCS